MNTYVKTFRAADPRDALDAVKAARGAEAVILQTREVGGGLWGKKEIEITAASAAHAAASASAQPAKNPLESEMAALRRIVEELRQELRHSRDERPPVDPIPP